MILFNLFSMIDLNKCLKEYKQRSAFYKEKLRYCKNFINAPFTTKEDLIKSQKAHRPYGKFTNEEKEISQIYRTSGTSDNPLLLSFTKKDVALISEIGAECFMHSGMGDFGNQEVVINCLNLSMWAGGFLDAQAMMKTGVQVINFGTGNTSELIKLILSFSKKFKVSLHCTPSYLPIIEQKFKEEYKKEIRFLSIHALYLGAEGGVQDSSYRNNIIKKWKSRVLNANYGMSEVCSIMASASEDNNLKYAELFLKKHFLELLFPTGFIKPITECKPGDVGEVVITSLFKESQPLFRYNTKERIILLSVKSNQIYFEVVGRSDDMIVYKGINIFPEQFRNCINKFQELTGIYKLIVKSEGGLIIKLMLVCEKQKGIRFNELDVKQRLSNLIKSHLSIRPEIQFVEIIERKGNKVKFIEFEEQL
jgi:phenylacetate-CoA ligase